MLRRKWVTAPNLALIGVEIENLGLLDMVVIFSVANTSKGAFEISVQRPQHTANASRTYASLEQTKGVLLNFGISQEVLDECLKLLPQVEAGKYLTFPPIDVPHHELAAEGFKLGIE